MGSLTKTYAAEKLHGRVFTPPEVVNFILDEAGYTDHEIVGKTVLDPACGDGAFLLEIARRIIRFSPPGALKDNLEKMYGWDVDEHMIAKAEKKLNELVEPLKIQVQWHLYTKDAIRESVRVDEQFDYIIGNPPYVRIQHLTLEDRKFIQRHYRFCKTGSTDLYIAFIELAINLLSDTGTCAYITPNTYFHTRTAQSLRDYFGFQRNIVAITNYGHVQLFSRAATYSAVTVFDRQKRGKFLYRKVKNDGGYEERYISFDELQDRKFWQLSVKKLPPVRGKKLGDIASIHVGITTLADAVYIMPAVEERDDYLYLQSAYTGVVALERAMLKPVIKASVLKNPDAPTREYVLFPYRKIQGKYRIIPEDILKARYPGAYAYLRKMKPYLDKRDNGKPNPVAWYAFGRSQALNTGFGKKILFSPMNKTPNFIFSENEEATFYSGYCIKYDGDYRLLLQALNSRRMRDFIEISARDFRNGWKAYNKKIVREFVVPYEFIKP